MATTGSSMTVTEIIRLTASEFQDVSDEDIEKYTELYAPLVSRIKFKSQYNHALALLICHRMKLAGLGDGDTAGGISIAAARGSGLASVSEGNTSLSFDNGTSSLITSNPEAADYALTEYGIQFLSLRKALIMPVAIDGSGVRQW